MTQYFYVDSTSGDLLDYNLTGILQGQTSPTVPLPSNSVEVTVSPSNNQMSWDFVNSVWYWKKSKLRDYARIIRQTQQDVLMISWKGLSRPLSFYLNVEWERMFDSAAEELSTDSRAVNMGRNYDDVLVATNAEIVTLEKAVNDGLQRLDAAYNAVAALIENATITDQAGVDSQWPTSAAAYSNTRTALAPLSEIAAALANKSNVGHTHSMAEEDQLTIPGTLLNATYFLIQKAKHAGTITSFVASCASLLTAGTYTIRINGVAVTGLTNVTNTITSTETNATAANTFVAGDVITISFTGSLTLLNFQGQLSTTRIIS